MDLQDFINFYGFYYQNDLEKILAWSRYNHNELELISLIGQLAKQEEEEKKKNDFRIKEWACYAMNLVPEITKETDGTTCINAIRLIYLAYEGKQFAEMCDKVMISDSINWDFVKNLHPEIYNYYMEVKNCE